MAEKARLAAVIPFWVGPMKKSPRVAARRLKTIGFRKSCYGLPGDTGFGAGIGCKGSPKEGLTTGDEQQVFPQS